MKSNSNILNLVINSEQIVESQSEKIVALWSLKFLLKLGGMKRFMEDGRIRYDDISEYLGLHVWFDDEEKRDEALERFAPGYRGKHETLAKKLVVESLENLMAKLEKSKCTTSPILERNIAKLAHLISLNTVEQDILRLAVYLKYYDVLTEASRTLGDLTIEQIYKVMSVILSTPKEVIREALMPRGRLNRSGIISIDRFNNSNSLSNKIDVASNGFVEKMMSCDEEDIEAMIKDSVRRCNPGLLTLDNYSHLDGEVSTMLGYLNKAIEHKISGVNILLYGQPGTGKTELVKTLATHMGIELFEVSFADDDDDPISGTSRLKAYRTAQTLLQNKTAMLMFDEIEDVFKDDDDNTHFGRRKSSNTKAWMNRILESNPIPAIWITNKVYVIDNAFIRRFDMVYEIPVPPKNKRQEIISTHAGAMVSEETLKRVATHENISPAIITRAAKVVSAISESAKKSSATFESLINNTIKAQGWRGLDEKSGPTLPKSYDPSFVNTSMNLKELLDGIRYAGSARICFYGVPGTGKSAFGQYLANELDKPFMLKKGSDLISKWVGETEKNIARAFKEAMEEKAVLVFDEVDSFLQDRRGANASWEVSQVNEMLVQMENYEGIFISTTNLMDGLDQAALRRFDLKLEFRFLKPDQALKLFTKEAELLGISTIPRSVQKSVQALDLLAPGDFAAVRRQAQFAPITSADEFVVRLSKEIEVKENGLNRKMGFLR